MRKCVQCGGRLKRVHRTFVERFQYLAIYECRDCKDVACIPRAYYYHIGDDCRCPRCGTLRITRLKERDHIDPMQRGIMNMGERFMGGKLYHCRYCRVQFYDRRNLLKKNESEQVRNTQSPAG
jgi:hypothetical protein